MDLDRYAENRLWAFRALDELERFLEDDDFEGDPEEHRIAIDRRRRELRDGKYRIVFLGAFNVGKSALVNALLGDEYLPMVLEECTTKITQVMRGPRMSAELRLSDEIDDWELVTLQQLLESHGVGASVERVEDESAVRISFTTATPRAMLQSLNALVTMNADDDFPQLKALRGKFEEIHLYLPSDFLQDDIALVDTPGVESISDTNERISHGLIPRSHLVILLIDSQSAGSRRNREYIERVVKQHRRKVFFVINKADQLNPEEIDPRGRRGPAKDLMRSLVGVVDDPEIFFISSLYALIANQLSTRKIRFDDLDADQKIKVPIGFLRTLLEKEDPVEDMAEYLMKRSNLPVFRNRLLQYLYEENREGVILDSVCRFIDDRAWKLARPLEIRLETARNIPRLDALRAEREELTAEIDTAGQLAAQARDFFSAMAEGGEFDGETFPGYEKALEDAFNETSIEADVLGPIRQWIQEDENLKEARAAGFEPLAREIERVVGGFVDSRRDRLSTLVETTEGRLLERFPDPLAAKIEKQGPLEVSPPPVGEIRAGLGLSYLAFGIIGALLGGGIGAAAVQLVTTSVSLSIPAPLYTIPAAGAAVGFLAGLVARASTSKEVLREKLAAAARRKVETLLFAPAREDDPETVPGAAEQLRNRLRDRRTRFADAVREAFDRKIGQLEARVNAIRREEEELRREQEQIIARLEPKAKRLSDLGERARIIAKRGGAAAEERRQEPVPTPPEPPAAPEPPAEPDPAPNDHPGEKPAADTPDDVG